MGIREEGTVGLRWRPGRRGRAGQEARPAARAQAPRCLCPSPGGEPQWGQQDFGKTWGEAGPVTEVSLQWITGRGTTPRHSGPGGPLGSQLPGSFSEPPVPLVSEEAWVSRTLVHRSVYKNRSLCFGDAEICPHLQGWPVRQLGWTGSCASPGSLASGSAEPRFACKAAPQPRNSGWEKRSHLLHNAAPVPTVWQHWEVLN